MTTEEIEKLLEQAGIGTFCTLSEFGKAIKKSYRKVAGMKDDNNSGKPKLAVFQECKGGGITVSRRCAAEYLAAIQTENPGNKGKA